MPARATIALHEVGTIACATSHAELRVVWGFEGAIELALDGRIERVAPGQSLVIAPGRPHALHAPRGGRCFVVSSGEAHHLERLLPLAGRVRAHEPALGYLLRYLAATPAVPSSAAELLLECDGMADDAAARPPRRAVDWSRLLAWIDAHLADRLGVAALAAQVHLSATQFTVRCTEELGIAPMALVRRQRLAAAQRLRALGLPVATVAARCGYRSPSALTAALRRAGAER